MRHAHLSLKRGSTAQPNSSGFLPRLEPLSRNVNMHSYGSWFTGTGNTILVRKKKPNNHKTGLLFSFFKKIIFKAQHFPKSEWWWICNILFYPYTYQSTRGPDLMSTSRNKKKKLVEVRLSKTHRKRHKARNKRRLEDLILTCDCTWSCFPMTRRCWYFQRCKCHRPFFLHMSTHRKQRSTHSYSGWRGKRKRKLTSCFY